MTQRSTFKNTTHMTFGLWLIFHKDGTARMTRTEPNVDLQIRMPEQSS